MAAIISNRKGNTAKSQRGSEESHLTKWFLISIALAFVGVFLLLPLVNVFYQAFSKGWTLYKEALIDPNTIAAIKLTLFIAAISVPLNLIFGLAAAWAIAKFEFPGKAFLITLIDLPFAVSPVVAGLMFVVLFGREGFFAEWLDARDIRIIFAWPGMLLATVFITFPFVARELIPVMQATGSEQEQAALTLGASGWKTFFFVTLPSVKWGLIYGVILCNARAMGEFGAVSVVSGHIEGITDTLPLRVDKLFHGASESSAVAAFVVASLLAVLALITLILKTILEWKTERDYARAQQAVPDEADNNGFASSDTVILAKSLQQ
ncbi:MAG TPA: sulfate ABC transporter permease subunit CysW [Candidatus Kapabacteria bacterium]|nr:sulfate ABC transporter permease subunit CysW [Candidatus Kapabacteria bacterium]